MARGSRKWVWIGGEGRSQLGEENEAHAERKDQAKVTGTCILKRPSMARGSGKWVWIGGEGEESAGRRE